MKLGLLMALLVMSTVACAELGVDWTQATAAAPWAERGWHGGESFLGQLWVLGGSNTSDILNDVWSSVNGTDWSLANPAAAWSLRLGPGVLVFNGQLWVLGGYNGNTLNDVWSSTDGADWSRATAGAEWAPRSWPGVAVFHGQMWISGGWGCSDVWSSSDGATWSLATDSALPLRWGQGLVVFKDKLWFIGGYDGIRHNDIWSSPDGIIWTPEVSVAPWSARNNFGTVVMDNRIWLLGGQVEGDGVVNDIWSSEDGINWTEVAAEAPWPPRSGQVAFAAGERMWLMGGYDGGFRNDVWYSEPSVPTPIPTLAPLSAEFMINSVTPGNQSTGRIAMDEAGNFMVAWTDYAGLDGSGFGVFARRFNAEATPLAGQFQVNSATQSSQYVSAAAMAPGGSFVVCWQDYGPGYGGTPVGQLFDAEGNRQGGQFRVVPPDPEHHTGYPEIAMNRQGDFAVAWKSYFSPESIQARIFNASATPQAGPFDVSDLHDTGRLYGVVTDATGDFLFVWQDHGVWTGDVTVRLFNAQATPLSAPVMVNSSTAGQTSYAKVGMQPDGDFVLAWNNGGGRDGDGYGVFARLFDAQATPLGAEFQVNSTTALNQVWPLVAVDAAGDFVIAWTSKDQDGSNYGAFGQGFNAQATPIGAEFQINSTTYSTQIVQSLAMSPAGEFIPVWRSWYQDGDGAGIFGRRYELPGAATPEPTETPTSTPSPLPTGTPTSTPNILAVEGPSWRGLP